MGDRVMYRVLMMRCLCSGVHAHAHGVKPNHTSDAKVQNPMEDFVNDLVESLVDHMALKTASIDANLVSGAVGRHGPLVIRPRLAPRRAALFGCLGACIATVDSDSARAQDGEN